MLTPRQRFSRVRRLRAIGAPAWVVKSEQVALVLAKKGLKYTGLGSTPSKAQSQLFEKYVTPLLRG